ncbi:SHC SH2 domain-binding protein 1 isoform X1 [Fundulus heteroclitus]|uniref:SHC SH2 domain-binding protein 1 isoform X1 n=1 Tax=Fundulus heteroclitus TaxID=8078 RepID=UPI00165B7ABE|nr:SHC SH2 domain-binding protein 1 isoform X1 [Fundulus heteroclitus]
MEQETQETACIVSDMPDMVVVELHSAVKAKEAEEGLPGAGCNSLDIAKALFQNENNENGEHHDDDDDDDDDDSGTDYVNSDKSGTQLQRCERHRGESSSLPDTFQTNNLLFYERFKAYQDYMLGDCKPSEVKAFTADYLEKALEPCDWLALWSTDVFDVVVEVQDLDINDLKAHVKLVQPLQYETRCEITEEDFNSLLEATQHKVPLMELQVVYDESGDFDQTALTLEHLRFFYKHIWRQWDEEDEDDDFDYFVRCVEPRLRLYYDILEDRVPAGLVAEYQSLLQSCSQCFQQFSELRSGLNADSDLEPDNVSMVEGLNLYDQLETLKRKLHIIENPLLRYVLAYKGSSRQQCVQSRGLRESGMKVVHVVTAVTNTIQLQSLLTARLIPLCASEDTEIQFHRDPVSAVDASHQGDTVIVLPGTYSVSSSIFIPDSITIEGFGFPDEVVIENQYKGDSFVESTGADVSVSNIKFIQHDAIEGILCVREGTVNMENCVLQCETTGVIVRGSARLTMNMCDLYGSKGAGVEIYPGSVCSLVSNGIHHCKDGVLIKDFANELDGMPSINLERNVIHNNWDYGVILVKPGNVEEQNVHACGSEEEPALHGAEDKQQEAEPASRLESAGTDGTDGDVAAAATAGRKWQFGRQLSRNKEASCSRPVQDLMQHQIFVSVQENQFKRNGKGDFGVFFY